MTYEQFKKNNDESKQFFPSCNRGTILSVSLKKDICTLRVNDRVTEVPISLLVRNIISDGLGVVTNPSLIRNWSGFEK